MRKITRKVISIMLAIMLTVSAVSADRSVVCAAEEDEELVSGDYKYKLLDDGTVEITEYMGEDAEVTIPATLDKYGVTSIERMHLRVVTV